MWLIVAIIGYALLAVVFILDKLIVSKSVSKPVVYAFYSAIFMFGALLALPFAGWGLLIGSDWCWAIVSGVAFGLGMWALYGAVKKGEATHVNPFNGTMVTIFIYLLASYFLKENLTSVQVAGMAVLIFASLLLSFEKSREHHGFHIGFIWAIVSGLFFAVSHVSAKYLYGQYPFWTAFIWSKAFVGLIGLFLLLFPSVRKSFHRQHSESVVYAKRHAKFIVLTNKTLSILAVVLIQYAMAIGSVTLVGAMSGLQYALMFILVYLLTKFLPKVFKEYFTKREMAVEIIAILLVCLGSIFFVL